MGRGHEHAGQGGAHRVRRGLLVRRIAVAVQEADRHRLDGFGPQPRDGVLERGRIERHATALPRRRRSRTPSRRCARHQRHRRRHAQVIAILLQAFAHLEDVAMAFGGEHAHLRALALEQRIGRDRGAVDDALGIAQQLAPRRAEPARQLVQPLEQAEPGIRRRGRGLGAGRLSVRVDRHQVGEGAADVDADDVAHAASPASVTRPARRSAACCAAVRCAGSPQPPPPAEWITRTSPGDSSMPTSLVRSGRPLPDCGLRT